VIALAEDGSLMNNANFVTGPDGEPGFLRMYLFDLTKPYRDGALENDIVIHEYTHGMSNRLTGGKGNANCIQNTEARGLGEGWSDAIAILHQMTESDTPASQKMVGQYVVNSPKGVRSKPYSTDMKVNPLTYSAVASSQEIHQMGEVWSTVLNEIYWGMVQMDGFVPVMKLTENADSGKGNSNYLKLIINGMKKQPCNPTFVQARDAILASDLVAFGGRYSCVLWKSFAKRGIGVNVKDDGHYVDNFDVIDRC
jgi:extracellular elastinolytic metalloproteinase